MSGRRSDREGRDIMSLPSPRAGTGFWVRVAGLALVDALAVWAGLTLWDLDQTTVLIILVVGVIVVNTIFLTPYVMPLRYLISGLLFMIVFVLYPIVFTVYLSMTNFAQDHNVSKDQAIRALQQRTFRAAEPDEYELYIYRDSAGELRFLTVDDEGETCFAAPRPIDAGPAPSVCEVVDVTDGPPGQVGEFSLLRLVDLLPLQDRITQLAVDTKDGEAVANTFSSAIGGLKRRYTYDRGRDVLIDNQRAIECPAGPEGFVCDGAELAPGWRGFVGGRNYVNALTEPRLAAPFLKVFSWNIAYALGVVLFQLIIGLGLALALHNTEIRGKKFYRSALLVPYAVPAFVSVLIWRGLLNADAGPLNDLIRSAGIFNLFGIDRIPWLLEGALAKAAVILVTVWQGFPYMMLIAMGALQSIPNELLEAAKVDGAGPWKSFWKVTFPMLMVIIAPLLIASFAFNFNNFVNIFLLTQGGPANLSYDVPVGETDLLLTFTFKLSQNSGEFALAATYSILIFFVVALIAALSYRFTARLERIYGNL